MTELERSLRALRLPGMGTTMQVRALAVASLIDRLMHHGHLLKFDGKSWRLREAAARVAKAATDH